MQVHQKIEPPDGIYLFIVQCLDDELFLGQSGAHDDEAFQEHLEHIALDIVRGGKFLHEHIVQQVELGLMFLGQSDDGHILCAKEQNPITPRPTLRSILAEYLAFCMVSGALSIKSCNTLSKNFIISAMKMSLSCQSSNFSKFKEDRQQTADLCLPW